MRRDLVADVYNISDTFHSSSDLGLRMRAKPGIFRSTQFNVAMKFRKDHSVGELLEQLLADALIDAYQISGESVTIHQGADRHTFPTGQAYTFLKGMLRGRSWNLSPGPSSPAEEEQSVRRQVEVPRAKAAVAVKSTVDHGSAVSPTSAAGPTPVNDSTSAAGAAVGPTLATLLSMAREMALIESWEFDDDGHSLTLVLPFCRSSLGRDEAVLYLSDCILHRLEVMREEVAQLSLAAEDGAAAGKSHRETPSPASSPRSKREARPAWEPLG